MRYEQDWLLRQIEMMAQFIARVIFGREELSYEIEEGRELTRADLTHLELVSLIARGKVCEAEDLLFERLDSEERDILAVAVDFYERLARFDDRELEHMGFSKEEIREGLEEVVRFYGISWGEGPLG